MTADTPLILLVEDDESLRDMLLTVLHAERFGTLHARSLASAQAQLHAAAQAHALPQLVLLDLNLPDGHGSELFARWPGLSALPVVVISARNDEHEKIALLDAGAQDYLVKPFGVGELLARIRVALRLRPIESAAPTLPAITKGALEIDLEARRVSLDGQWVKLTATEFNILACLARQPGRIATHRQILSEVWGAAFVEHTHYLRVFVASLRAKIEPVPTQPRYVMTEIGVGYRLADLD